MAAQRRYLEAAGKGQATATVWHMPRWRETLVLLPAALLASAAIVAAFSHAGPLLSGVLAGAAVGTFFGGALRRGRPARHGRRRSRPLRLS